MHSRVAISAITSSSTTRSPRLHWVCPWSTFASGGRRRCALARHRVPLRREPSPCRTCSGLASRASPGPSRRSLARSGSRADRSVDTPPHGAGGRDPSLGPSGRHLHERASLARVALRLCAFPERGGPLVRRDDRGSGEAHRPSLARAASRRSRGYSGRRGRRRGSLPAQSVHERLPGPARISGGALLPRFDDLGGAHLPKAYSRVLGRLVRVVGSVLASSGTRPIENQPRDSTA